MRELSIILGLGTLLLVGCSAGAEEEPEEASFVCSVSARSGTYLLTYDEVDGTCGELPTQVVRLDPGAPLNAGCMLDEPTTISADECSVDTSASCTDSQTGFTVSLVGTTKQTNASGSVITGIGTITVRDTVGPVCLGTYRLRYERQ